MIFTTMAATDSPVARLQGSVDRVTESVFYLSRLNYCKSLLQFSEKKAATSLTTAKQTAHSKQSGLEWDCQRDVWLFHSSFTDVTDGPRWRWGKVESSGRVQKLSVDSDLPDLPPSKKLKKASSKDRDKTRVNIFRAFPTLRFLRAADWLRTGFSSPTCISYLMGWYC